MLTVRHRRSEIPFVPHEEMQRCLMNLGLYQLAVLPQSKIDQSLMHGIAERWRPATHTFHLLVGEMTVTLGDVSALWGLRIDGEAERYLCKTAIHLYHPSRLFLSAIPSKCFFNPLVAPGCLVKVLRNVLYTQPVHTLASTC